MEWHPAPQPPLGLGFNSSLGKALGGGVCCGGCTSGRVARGRCKPQTPSVPPKARPEPPGACVCSQQTPGGADRCSSHPATPLLPGLLGWPKPPQLGALWGQGAWATQLPCTSRDARQSGRSEESCRVKGRDVQCPGLGPYPLCPQRWLPCSRAGWPCAITPKPWGQHVVQGPLGVWWEVSLQRKPLYSWTYSSG